MEMEQVIQNLEKNNMQGYYAADCAAARDIVRQLLTPGATVANGGSITLRQCGIQDIISGGDYQYIRRSKPDGEHKAASAAFYFTGSNAITEDGVLYNVDGYANRVSALCFGPKNVIVVAGRNKIVKNLDEAVYRVKTVAAPMNAARLSCNTYCAKNGKCVSLLKENPDMSDGCSSEQRICCSYVITAQQRVKNRIKVILIDEELGF